MDKHSKRNKSKDNPYTLSYNEATKSYVVEFKDNKNAIQKVEITEEIYQELYHDNKSIHLTEIKPLKFNFKSEIKNGDLIMNIISQARGEKTINNVSLKTPIKNLDLNLNS